MRSSLPGLLIVLASTTGVRANDDLAALEDPAAPDRSVAASAVGSPAEEHAPARVEVGAYGGTFISNYYHQYYELDKWPGAEGETTYRPELERFSPLVGIRLAYFFKPWLGGEVDFNVVMAKTKVGPNHPTSELAHIYSGRAQLMFQAPNLGAFVPFIAIGDGFGHVASEYLGSDTDYPPFIAAGARFLVSRTVTLRIDGRWMRAPTPHEPWTLNCNLGELMLGVSLRPGRRAAVIVDEPEPPKDVVVKTDSDGDGIPDTADRCANEPEDKDGYQDNDGCLELDNDGDAIVDASDKCPAEAEDKDSFQDDDGCIDRDNDNDGIADLQDRCINEAEDVDSFKDNDGCPDLDNDSDGFADTADKCPTEAEVINGTDDDDGCPDRGNALVVVSPDRLELLENIEFKATTLQKKSTNVLSQIGATLRANPGILRLRITVHMQPTKNAERDRRVSEQRAFAIREWLINYGIEEKRLDPRGFGGTKPLVPAAQKGAKAINERIELIILERQ